jgi:steroid delta-isomerase-like uncharacterized protein
LKPSLPLEALGNKEEIEMSVTLIAKKNKEVVRKLYEVFLNTGKLESLDQVIAEDYVGPNDQRGPSALAETIQGIRQGFPDIQWTVEDLVAEGDKVVVRWSWRGTHSGSFRGFPASQKQVTNNAIAIYQFRDNKIVHAWMQTDQLGFLQQIGVIPQDLGAVPQPQR